MRTTNRSVPFLAGAVALALAVSSCRREDSTAGRQKLDGQRDAPRHVTLLLNWFPEAEHGGFYTAQVNGYYAEEGLEVEILPGGPGASVVPRVATGAVQFGVENADHVLMARAQDAEVVAVMAPIQVHPRCIMVHEGSGIARLQDLRDMTLAMNAGGAFSHYLRRHVALDGVKIVPFSGSITQFLTDKGMAQQAYVFSEPYLARQAGANPRSLLLADIGFNPYTSCLLTCDELLEREPDTVRAMVRASVKGWKSYLEDADDTHALIHKLNPEMTIAALEFGREALRELVENADARDHGIGTMRPERWQQLHDQLVDIDLIPADTVVPADCFTTDFLPE